MANPFSFSGRMRRWHYIPSMVGFSLLLNVLGKIADVMPLFVMAAATLTLWPITAMTAQRAHDSGRSTKFALFAVIPVVASSILISVRPGEAPDVLKPFVIILIVAALIGLIMELVITWARGDEGPNEYGPDPRGREGNGHETVS